MSMRSSTLRLLPECAFAWCILPREELEIGMDNEDIDPYEAFGLLRSRTSNRPSTRNKQALNSGQHWITSTALDSSPN